MNPVSIERHDDVAVISIDNPPVNALSHAVRVGIATCIEAANNDAQIKAVILHCSGRTFIAGADIREFGQPAKSPHLPDIINQIESCQKPVIAAIHGTALGGGLEVAMGCHYRLALASASVGLPEVNLGLLPGATGTQRLPRLVGVQKALDMMISGSPVKASAALTAGLLDRVTDDDLLPAALDYARAIIAEGANTPRIRDLPVASVDKDFFTNYRQQIARKTRGLFSPERIIQCVEFATTVPFDEAVAKERELFQACKDSPQSAGLRHAFFAERAVAKVPGLDPNTTTRDLHKAVIIGAGTMGAGIAYACANAGFDVVLLDNDAAGLERGQNTIKKLFSVGVERGKLTQTEMEQRYGRLSFSDNFDALADADIVIEAVFENMAIKKEIFARLDAVCKSGAILASNTSTLDIDAIAAATGRPADVIGLHFFSPAHIMKLLEIVRGRETSDEVIATSLQLARRLGKIGTVVGNCFGFVGNRMLYSYGRENQLMLLEGAAPEYIDKVLYDWGMAMGPNAVGDLAGLDVGYKVRQERTDLPDDPRFYRVANKLAELGRFGQKTGKGMYLYLDGSHQPTPDPVVTALIKAESDALGIKQRKISAEEIIERCIYGLVVEGTRILEDGIASRSSDIDVIWMHGYGFPRYRGGPMHYADSVGLDKVYAKVCEFNERFGPMYWQPPELLKKLASEGKTFADYSVSEAGI
jgi:3-hydroxyacyl-CoA dehydrogenase